MTHESRLPGLMRFMSGIAALGLVVFLACRATESPDSSSGDPQWLITKGTEELEGGRAESAARRFSQAAERSLEQENPDAFLAAATLLGKALLDLNRFDEASLYFQKAVELAESLDLAGSPFHLAALRGLAEIALMLNNQLGAEALLNEAVQYDRSTDNPDPAAQFELSQAYLELGKLLRASNKFHGATTYLNRALALLDTIQLTATEIRVQAWVELSSAYGLLGQRSHAWDALTEGQAVLDRGLGVLVSDRAELQASIQLQRALQARFEGRWRAATRHLEQSVETLSRQFGMRDPAVLMQVCGLAGTWVDLHNCNEAFELAEEANRVWFKAHGEPAGLCLDQAARAQACLGNWPDSLSLLQSAISKFEQAGLRLESHRVRIRLLETLRQLGSEEELAIALRGAEQLESLFSGEAPLPQRVAGRILHALIARDLDDLETAERLLHEAAPVYERVRKSWEKDPLGLLTLDFSPYRPLATTQLLRGKHRAAWHSLEMARGRLLRDLLASIDSKGVPSTVVSPEEVSELLESDEALVGWVDDTFAGGLGQSWAFVIRRQKESTSLLQWEELPDEDPAILAEEIWRRQLLQAEDENAIKNTAKLIWKRRFSPLEPHLRGIRRLVVIPSERMIGIPIAALTDPDDTDDPDDTYLADRFEIAYLPSASEFVRLRRQFSGSTSSLRIANTLVLSSPPMKADTPCSAPNPSPLARLGQFFGFAGLIESCETRPLQELREECDLGALPPLDNAYVAAEDPAAVVPGKVELKASQATERQLDRVLAQSQFDLIHISSHAIICSEQPLRSAIVLSQEDIALPDIDGLMSAREVLEGPRLESELVTLAACRTALGRATAGDGFLGFPQVLLYAGSRSVLVSLWSVGEHPTRLLTRRFYELWLGAEGSSPVSKAKALSEAQRWLRKQGFSDPLHWAAFILIGDPV